MGEPKYRDEEWLREQYVSLDKTQAEIAEKCSVQQKTISRWCDRHGIETRSVGRRPDERLKSEEWLRRRYIQKNETTYEIADAVDCSPEAVRKALKKADIDRRHKGPIREELG